MKLIPIDECVKGRLYEIDSRNLGIAVFDGKDGFIGIRYKFGEFLFTENHWDADGTVEGMVDTGINIPDGIEATENDMLFGWLKEQEKTE
jgi:hypothetical protein